MRKGTIKAAVLAAVFIGAVLIFGRFMNDTNEDLTTEMKEATLPVITMYQGDQELNELHGYVTEMDAAYMRDTITPVGEDRKLPIVIQTNQTAVDTISYEIRSLDATRLIANADVTSYEERSGKITADLQIQNLLEEGEEYLMIIRLGSGDRSICYYTRIAEPVDCYVSECVAFVKDFNDKTFNDETSGTLATYMERTTGDNTTLQFVSLNSSLKQVSWADFKGERLTEPVPSIKEITPTYNVIVLDYVVSSVNESGQIEYYNIEEYYRVRYTTSRIYLLNFRLARRSQKGFARLQIIRFLLRDFHPQRSEKLPNLLPAFRPGQRLRQRFGGDFRRIKRPHIVQAARAHRQNHVRSGHRLPICLRVRHGQQIQLHKPRLPARADVRPRRQHMHVVFLDAHHLDRRAVRNFRKNPPASARPIPQIDDSPSAGVRHKHRQNTLRPIRRTLRKQNDFVFAAVPRQHIPLQLIRHTNMHKDLTRTILHTFEHFDGRSAEIHHPNI